MPLGGLRTDQPADMIGEKFSPNLQNVRMRFGKVESAPGRRLFLAAPVNEEVQELGEFSLANGMVWTIMFTRGHLWKYGNVAPGTPPGWFDVGSPVNVAGTRRWSFAVGEDHLFFSRGDDALLQWDGVAAHQFDLVSTVSGFQGVSGGAATMGIAAVVVGAGGTGYAVDDVLDVAGGTGGQVKVLTVSGGVVLTVGIVNEGTGYSTGVKATTESGAGSGTGCTINVTSLNGGLNVAPAARFVRYFDNSVVLGNVTEKGVVKQNRVRWTESGFFNHWDEDQLLGAGFNDIWAAGNTDVSITGMEILGNRLVIYKEHLITEMYATGSSPRFVFEDRVHGIGCAAPYTLANNGQMHFFLGHDKNVWVWDGTTCKAIGDPIWNLLKTVVQDDSMEDYFGFISHHRQEYWLVLSGTGRVLVFDYGKGYWVGDLYGDIFAANEVDISSSVLTWSTAPGTWLDHPEEWFSLVGTTLPVVLAGLSDGRTMSISDTYVDDELGEFDRFIETEDISLPDQWALMKVMRLFLIYEFISEASFEVGYSLDRGVSWRTLNVVPSAQGYSFVDFIATGNVIRFRFRGDNVTGKFGWRGYMFEYEPAGDFIGTRT